MKKKTIEKLAEQRLQRINDLEFLLGKRKKEIKNLKEEVEGCRQVMQILEAFIIEGVEKKDEVQIPINKLKEGLKTGYKIEVTEDKYILRREEKAETEH